MRLNDACGLSVLSKVVQILVNRVHWLVNLVHAILKEKCQDYYYTLVLYSDSS
jgi:hypothetical protein